MGNEKYLDAIINRKLKDMHTAYLGKVLAVNGNTAKVQPLGLIKAYGGEAQKQAVVSNVPIATQKVKAAEITYLTPDNMPKKQTILVPESLAIGDIVICVCCDRDITDAKKGKNTLPPIGHHSLSDSVIVGVL